MKRDKLSVYQFYYFETHIVSPGVPGYNKSLTNCYYSAWLIASPTCSENIICQVQHINQMLAIVFFIPKLFTTLPLSTFILEK